jgi:hypothetical protein
MIRTFAASVLAALLALATTAAAQACLNDRETKGRETEFKSQYTPSTTPDVTTPSPDSQGPLDYVLFGAGGTLGVSGLGIGYVAMRRPR